MEKKTEHEQMRDEWQTFSNTLAYKNLMEYIELQKETHSILAGGPLEVGINDASNGAQLSFEPEKYAYLLQRSVGCDIVKIYIDSFVDVVNR